MTATVTANGKPRKQLSEQLDRMDTIIDALADALPEAVTDAVREGAVGVTHGAPPAVLRRERPVAGDPHAPPSVPSASDTRDRRQT